MKFILILFCLLNVVLATDAVIKRDYVLMFFNLSLLFLNSRSLDMIIARENENEKDNEQL